MRRVVAATMLLIALSLAGCLSDDGPANMQPNSDGSLYIKPNQCGKPFVDADGVNVVSPSADVIPIDEEGDPLDPWDFQATNYRTCTIRKVGHTELRDGNPHNYLGEIDMRGDLNLGVVAGLGSSEVPTVYLLDITERANPTVLSTITQFDTYIVDVKISDDGNFLFTASQNTPDGGGEFPPDPIGVTVPMGFSIYDISDRANPTWLQFVPSATDRGCHMISHEVIDGTDVVFCVAEQIEAHGLLRVAAGMPWVYLGPLEYFISEGSGTTADSPIGCVNEGYFINQATGQVNGPTGGAAGPIQGLLCNGPHDMTVAVDDVDGRTYMVVSHWDEGLRVVDVSAPIDDGFVEVGTWTGEGAKHYAGNVHTAMMFWVGEKRYVVATPELTGGGVVPALWVLDATQLDGELELVAEWYNPSEFTSPGLLMTTHQWQVAPTGPDAHIDEVNIYITMNHNGLWVLDFAEILAGDLQGAIGGFHMSRAPLDREQEVSAAVYSTWDVNVVDGYIYGSDRATGLWVFDYTNDAWNDERLTGWA